jgi:cysteine-rich repeat protein
VSTDGTGVTTGGPDASADEGTTGTATTGQTSTTGSVSDSVSSTGGGGDGGNTSGSSSTTGDNGFDAGTDANDGGQTVIACGNGIREGSEQCDDGNTLNLDGCDSNCQFEQLHRINWFKVQFASDANCPSNAFGGALVQGNVRSAIQGILDMAIANGSISILLRTLGLADLTGTNAAPFQLGVLDAAPLPPGGVTVYDGTNDLDWWYDADPSSIDVNRLPNDSLTASIAGNLLTTQPGSATFSLGFGFAHMSGLTLQVKTGSSNAPLLSGGDPPGHLASENLDPALTSFATAGLPDNGNNANAGALCGNISAASLAAIPSSQLGAAGSLIGSCTQGYDANNTSLLDLLVGGCTINAGFFTITAVAATQPNKVDPAVPAAGVGGPYKLSASSGRKIDTCKDTSNTVVPLSTCLGAAAYSSYFKFTTDRVIVR